MPTTPTELTGPEQVWQQYFGDEGEQQYIVNDLRERHLAVLLQDGQDFFWLKRKLSGTRCPFWDDQAGSCRKPIEPNASCFNTGYLGGYEMPLLIKAALSSANRQNVFQEGGLLKSQQMRPWTIWEPRLTDRDVLVNSANGERFEVLDVQESGPWRGHIVCQFFNVKPLQVGVDFAMNVAVAIPGGPR